MFSGTFTALITPFKNGEVDVEALEGLVEFQIEGGVSGLVPCGTTGESPTLSEAEDRVVIETVVRVANGRVPVIAGTGSNSTDMAIKYTKMAQEVGADGSLQVSPYYNKPTQDGLYAHFATIAESTDLPIVVYNIPGRTGVTVAPETMARLSEIPNIVATKDSTLSMASAAETKRLCGEEFDLLSGDDPVTLPIIALGGTGAIAVASNIAPRAYSEMTNAALSGDFGRARELHYDLLRLFNALSAQTNPIPVKTAASVLGLCSDEMRLPMQPMSGEALKKLRSDLEELSHLLPTPEEVK
ncbi:dapA: dihydrodipicolinate synthase [Rubrobacter radiotolerans]|uniref:4-hydroxy-tetrahydrodipicolinate synthase n=1 Tax=Rubrobacter radiotolerans TaxID=42256 RepID=A0A023X797_RUBRA|nr:4-hydroxy-tetrahydrodipicolinate synthase [Rubrobacter radiotolerans]AHY47939.1 dapA: dihydrodipicolinate synthase [Rubrobacter radiotolerans]MDX5892578.1 4-hydroxy-tetrahydrodipicolinate synthase [Rubrobacter radiotolerans]SMC07867.1 dihydrodipicolinate synthase [Rubrobacter radiotolerans DSM 5868]